MLTTIINSYFHLFITIGFLAVFIFSVGVFIIFKIVGKPKPKKSPLVQAAFSFHPQDFSAIAGEDVMSTQLDLARAYIESDKKELAKVILRQVMVTGSPLQQQEAHRLLEFI